MATDKATSPRQGADQRRTFAVTSLGRGHGRGRWYWVVWPSVVQVRKGEASGHLAEGFAGSKLEAIDQALAVAGEHAQWLAAGYARRYYHSRAQSQATSTVARQEFLYYDMRTAAPGGQKRWRSLGKAAPSRSGRLPRSFPCAANGLPAGARFTLG